MFWKKEPTATHSTPLPLTPEIILLSAPEGYDAMDAMNLAPAEKGKGNTKHGDDRHLESDPGHSCVY